MRLIQLLTFFALFSFSSAFAYVENMRDDMCPNKMVAERNTIVSCEVNDAQIVSAARVGANLTAAEKQALSFYTYGVVDMGIVDDSGSSTAYSYLRWLVDNNNRKVGLIDIQGWTNYSMGDRARFDVRMNLDGDIVSVREIEW